MQNKSRSKRQPPACQRILVATKDRSGWTQCQAEKTGDTEQTTRGQGNKREEEQTFIENLKRVAQQCEGPGGQYLADLTTLPFAVVKVARSLWDGQHATVIAIKKLLMRGKKQREP